MPAVTLTPKQQRFLDDYIREHRFKGRVKKAEAEKFLRRKGKVLDEMYRLPDERIPQQARTDLTQADNLATAGKFSEAYRLLKDAKTSLRAIEFDCRPQIEALAQEIDAFLNRARVSATKWQEFENWRNATYVPQYRAIEQLLPEGTELQPPAAQAEQQDWVREQLAAIDRKEAAISALDASMETSEYKLNFVERFLDEAQRKVPDFSARIGDSLRYCQKSPENQQALRALALKLTGQEELRCLQDPSGKYLPTAALVRIRTDHTLAVEQWGQELARQRVEVRRKVAVKSGVSEPIQAALADASQADQRLKAETDERSHPARARKARFDMGAFTGEKLTGISKNDAAPQVLQRARQTAAQAVGELMQAPGPGDEDKLFDLRMKSPLDFKIAFALSQGWLTPQDIDQAGAEEEQAIREFQNQSPDHRNAPFNDEVKGKFVEAQIRQRLAGPRGDLADAIAHGMFEEVQARSDQRLNLETGELTLGGELGLKKNYTRGAKLGEGGLGVAYAYEGEDGQRVVVKSIKAGGQKGREDMQKEIWSNRYLADADDEAPGKGNVLKMLDAVQAADGTLHMVMEMGVGDVNLSKMAMKSASDDGLLPEPARALVNQYMLKQALEGVRFLRDEGMVHFDLKEENLMVMPDGSVKVLDFGGVLIHEPGTDQFPAGEEHARTSVYSPNEPDSTKHDTYAMGRAASAMQAGELAPRVAEAGKHEHLTNLTGAFGRLAEAMVAQPDQRATLDAALESTYLQNLNSYSEDAVRELLSAVVDYGKSASAKRIAICRERIAAFEQEIAKLVTAMRSEVIKELEARQQDPAAVKKQDPAVIKKLEYMRNERQKYADELSQLTAKLGEPEIRARAERIRDLSHQLLRPSDDLAERPVEQLRDFLTSLQSTLDSPHSFANFVSLPGNRPYWKKLGVRPGALAAAAKGQSLNFTKENPRAREDWEETLAAAQQAVAAVNDGAVRGLLSRGLDNMLMEFYEVFTSDRLNEPTLPFRSLDGDMPPAAPARVQHSPSPEPQLRFRIGERALVTDQTLALCQDVLAIAPVACEFVVKAAPGQADPDVCSVLIEARVAHVAQVVNRSLVALAEELRHWQPPAASDAPPRGPSEQAAQRVLAESRRLSSLVMGLVVEVQNDLKKLGANEIEFDDLPGFSADADKCVTLATNPVEAIVPGQPTAAAENPGQRPRRDTVFDQL